MKKILIDSVFVGLIVAAVFLVFSLFNFLIGGANDYLVEKNLDSQPTMSGTVDDKLISGNDYHVIIDDKAYTTEREEWNKITDGDEVEYREKSSGEIIIENVE